MLAPRARPLGSRSPPKGFGNVGRPSQPSPRQEPMASPGRSFETYLPECTTTGHMVSPRSFGSVDESWGRDTADRRLSTVSRTEPNEPKQAWLQYSDPYEPSAQGGKQHPSTGTVAYETECNSFDFSGRIYSRHNSLDSAASLSRPPSSASAASSDGSLLFRQDSFGRDVPVSPLYRQDSFGRDVPVRQAGPVPETSLASSYSTAAPYSASSPTICFVCKLRLPSGKDIVRTEGGSVHMSCFRCRTCRMSLVHSEFYLTPLYSSHERALFCHVDYHEKFSPKCNLCKTPIESQGTFALGKHWHSNHFFCTECSKPFDETQQYFVLDDMAVCEPCHINKTAVKCWKCGHSCVGTEEAIEALGRQWCTTCFACDTCTSRFTSAEFILQENGDLVCNSCELRRLKEDCWKWQAQADKDEEEE